LDTDKSDLLEERSAKKIVSEELKEFSEDVK